MDSQQLGYYSYQPLGPRDIRLLSIEPYIESPEESIKVNIEVVSLDDEPRYDALSYTWGSPTVEEAKEVSQQMSTNIPRCCEIFCGSNVLRVTKNLRDAMLRLRQWRLPQRQEMFKDGVGRAMEHLIWIDGICINQDDLLERSLQVALMGKIYSRANLVLAWIGEHDAISRNGFNVCCKLFDLGQKLESGNKTVFPTSFNNKRFWKDVGEEPLSDEEWRDWILLLSRRWWLRTWVMQEAGLGMTRVHLLCGSIAVALDSIINSLTYVRMWGWLLYLLDDLKKSFGPEFGDSHEHMVTGHPFQWMPTIWESRREGIGYPFHLLQEFLSPNTHCHDPRDIVYGTMGLAAEFDAPDGNGFEVDYGKSVSHVYTTATKWCISKAKALDLLSLAGYDEVQSTSIDTIELPSWCPNYHARVNDGHRPFPLDYQPRHTHVSHKWCATGQSEYVAISGESAPFELTVSGIRCDTVSQIALTRYGGEKGLFCDWYNMSEILNVLQNLKPIHGVGPSEMLWRTLVHDSIDLLQKMEYPACPAPVYTAYFFRANLWYTLRSILQNWPMNYHVTREDLVHLAPRVTQLMTEDRAATMLLPDLARYLDINPEEIHNDPFWENDRFAQPLGGVLCSNIEHISPLRNAIHGRVGFRRLFRTQEQRLGLGLKTVRPGDEIWLLAGGRVPYVLRRLQHGKYRFLGEAYVYGIMLGEAWPQDGLSQSQITLV